jgi:exopolyphosphatase/guanosine-5'-triphosphate,3'-diphosphate pyrophosphatase
MKILRKGHNFEEDIIAASRVIAKRYKSSKQHVEHVEELCIEIFNKTRKIHGLGQRERLLLQIAAILHDCGKYISLTNYYECVYNIVMATEIIGLSHRERRMIATIVRFDTAEFGYYDDWFRSTGVTREEYIIITKLTAILRIANALDRSCTQKCRGASVTVKNDQLQISVATQEDLTLEALTLEQRADFFEEVFSIRPVIRQKKKL